MVSSLYDSFKSNKVKPSQTKSNQTPNQQQDRMEDEVSVLCSQFKFETWNVLFVSVLFVLFSARYVRRKDVSLVLYNINYLH